MTELERLYERLSALSEEVEEITQQVALLAFRDKHGGETR